MIEPIEQLFLQEADARARGQDGEANELMRRAMEEFPQDSRPYAQRCHAHLVAGEADLAIEAGRKALTLMPDNAPASFHLGLALLMSGQYEEGWRRRQSLWWGLRTPPFSKDMPSWTGEDLSGKRLLTWSDGGNGDAIMMARYLPLLRERGARVGFSVNPSLAPLFAPLVDADQPKGWDYQIAMMSLPLAMGMPEPYWGGAYIESRPQPPRAPGAKLSVGICWAGNPRHSQDAHRSVRLAEFSPLLAIDGVRFVSLQLGPERRQLATDSFDISDTLGEDATYADTAKLVADLDLVVSVDTSVVHLAGAMGKPTWVILGKRGLDWRWGLTGERTPWYPSMRLFRNRDIEGTASALRELIESLAPS